MTTKTYSNGAENLDADFLMMSGTQVGAHLRIEDGFFNFEAGAIDAPEWMAAGAMLRGAIRGDTPAATPAIFFRNWSSPRKPPGASKEGLPPPS